MARGTWIAIPIVCAGELGHFPDAHVSSMANTGVLNLATGTVTWLGASKFAAVAYE